MKPKVILGLAIVGSGILFGCKSPSNLRVDIQRQRFSIIYQDQTRPMTERVEAFNNLLATFTSGTREKVIDHYVQYTADDTKSRLDVGSDFFSLHLIAPDGSDRWKTMHGDKVD